MLGAAFAVAEEDLLAVVVDLRVAHAAAGVVEQRGELAGGQVPAVELGAFAPGLALGVVGVVADVRVPVAVGLVHLAGGEDDLGHARHRAGAEPIEQARRGTGRRGAAGAESLLLRGRPGPTRSRGGLSWRMLPRR